MTVKDLIKHLSKFDENLDVVFYNEILDGNHWGCELSVDDCNGKDLMIYPTIEDQLPTDHGAGAQPALEFLEQNEIKTKTKRHKRQATGASNKQATSGKK